VFEVHRSSRKAGAVSSGLEDGWLAFVHGEHKRRLAPFPPEWVGADASELERLCAMARVAPAPRAARAGDEERRRVPRPTNPTPPEGMAPLPEPSPVVGTPTAESVEHAVRAFAQRARLEGLPAIEAMVQLKLLLADQFPGATSAARDLRRVRRWFVEAYYFERDA
jgi:hypothetical protein